MQKWNPTNINVCLAIRAIRGTWKEKIYQELGLESLQLRRWYNKLCLFYKVFKYEHSKYLFNIIQVRSTQYATRTEGNIPLIKTKHNFFMIFFFFFFFFFHLLLFNGKTLIHVLETLTKYFIFKEKIINFIRPSPNAFFERHNPQGIKLITRLRLGLRHLRKHKFKHSF